MIDSQKKLLPRYAIDEDGDSIHGTWPPEKNT